MKDIEDIASVGFLLLGLGFFILITLLVTRDDHVQYARKLNEMREFGMHQNPKKWNFRRKNL